MIEELKIRNYKSIRDLTLKLKPINVLIGANGAGKSNFISFFKLLHIIYEQHLSSYVASVGGVDNLLHFGRKQSDYLFGLINFDNQNAYQFELKPNIRNQFYFEEEAQLFNGYQKPNYSDWYRANITPANREESALKETNSQSAYHLKPYFEEFKVFHFHDSSDSAKIKLLNRLHDNKYLKSQGENLAAFLFFLQKKYPKHFKRIVATVRSIAPFFDRFDLAPDRFDETSIQLEWKEKGSDMYLNAHHLSDGSLRFIALATLLMQPQPPKTIIIDEPELGLHPVAINKLAALIKKASVNSQIIISTQSTNLVDNFTPEDIVVVNRADNQSTFNRLEKEQLEAWLEDYSLGNIWSKNLIGGRP